MVNVIIIVHCRADHLEGVCRSGQRQHRGLGRAAYQVYFPLSQNKFNLSSIKWKVNLFNLYLIFIFLLYNNWGHLLYLLFPEAMEWLRTFKYHMHHTGNLKAGDLTWKSDPLLSTTTNCNQSGGLFSICKTPLPPHFHPEKCTDGNFGPYQRHAVRNRPVGTTAEQKPGTGWRRAIRRQNVQISHQGNRSSPALWLMETGRRSFVTFCGNSIITLKTLTFLSKNVQE